MAKHGLGSDGARMHSYLHNGIVTSYIMQLIWKIIGSNQAR